MAIGRDEMDAAARLIMADDGHVGDGHNVMVGPDPQSDSWNGRCGCGVFVKMSGPALVAAVVRVRNEEAPKPRPAKTPLEVVELLVGKIPPRRGKVVRVERCSVEDTIEVVIREDHSGETASTFTRVEFPATLFYPRDIPAIVATWEAGLAEWEASGQRREEQAWRVKRGICSRIGCAIYTNDPSGICAFCRRETRETREVLREIFETPWMAMPDDLPRRVGVLAQAIPPSTTPANLLGDRRPRESVFAEDPDLRPRPRSDRAQLKASVAENLALKERNEALQREIDLLARDLELVGNPAVRIPVVENPACPPGKMYILAGGPPLRLPADAPVPWKFQYGVVAVSKADLDKARATPGVFVKAAEAEVNREIDEIEARYRSLDFGLDARRMVGPNVIRQEMERAGIAPPTSTKAIEAIVERYTGRIIERERGQVSAVAAAPGVAPKRRVRPYETQRASPPARPRKLVIHCEGDWEP